MGMTGMKAHIQRSSVLEDSPRRKLKKASSPVPRPKTAGNSYPSTLHKDSSVFREKWYILSEHLRESEAAGELSASHTRAKGAREGLLLFLTVSADIMEDNISLPAN